MSQNWSDGGHFENQHGCWDRVHAKNGANGIFN
jgi:hypothetical protein